MIKKIGLVAAVAAAGMVFFGGMASATTWGGSSHDSHGHDGGIHHTLGDNGLEGQVGLVNLNNLDLLHNVNANLGLCDNDINVLGVQVPVRDSLNGLGVPVLSPGDNTAQGDGPSSCAAGTIVDGGTGQVN
jgi:hypothetical protein